MLQELLDLGRSPREEGLDGPVTFSSPAYMRVTCCGKECLPSARNQRERNSTLKRSPLPFLTCRVDFLKGQLKWIGDCAHKPSFKFEGKRPSVILSHLVKESCTLHTTHPDLVQYAEWCRAL
ncbi:hypothetical protein BT69DRAFT_64614 [Atractiella rhizophila]|nr:hypothetical protein BT69DRAFT_64614 [Atractiella rhizophila]